MSQISYMKFRNSYGATEFKEFSVIIPNDADLDEAIMELATSIYTLFDVPEDEIEKTWWYKAYQECLPPDVEEAEIVE